MKIIFCWARETTTTAVPPTDVGAVAILASGAASTPAICASRATAELSWCCVEIWTAPSATAAATPAAPIATATRGTHGERLPGPAGTPDPARVAARPRRPPAPAAPAW